MRWLYAIRLRLRWLFRRNEVESELDEEIRFHLERQAQEHIARGIEPGEAHRRAGRAFRDVERAKEECRDMRQLNFIEYLRKDFAYAVRALRHNPVFTAAAALTIALGIGASTAIFGVADAVLLRDLPYREPDRLVAAFRVANSNGKSFLYAHSDFLDVRAGSQSVFDDIAGVATYRAFVTREDGSAEQLSRALVTTNFFHMMGARIVAGRDFGPEDAAPQPLEPGVLIPTGSTAILSYAYWQRRYGGSSAIIGQEMRGLGAHGPRIVGVLGPNFRLYFPPDARVDPAPDYWVANTVAYGASSRNLLMDGAVARLKSGITLREAQQRITALSPSLMANSIAPKSKIVLQPVRDYLVAEVRPALVALSGAAIFLLLIACANVANLLLVRASLRQRELAVRSALGASRHRLVSQILAEASLLAICGTALGVGIAWAGIRGLLAIAPANVPRLETAAIDWRVLLFAAAAGVASTILFGLAPAWRSAQCNVMAILRGAGRGAMSGPVQWRNGVVAGEVALSFVLLTGCGLMFRSLLELRRVDPGYNPHGLLTFYLTRDWPRLEEQHGRIELLRRIQSGLRELPGVQNVSASLTLPLEGGSHLTNQQASAQQRPPADATGADMLGVLPGYFETMGTPLLAGRTFVEADNAPGRPVAVIDRLLAERAFPHQSAVGKRIAIPFWRENPSVEVIGVVENQRAASLASPGHETIYFSEALWGIGVSRYWVVRTSGDPAKLAAPVHAELAKIDPQLVQSKVQTMDALVEQDQAGTRFSLFLIGAFASIAVLLAAVGLYGVVATQVEQRTAEIGLRMALGAAPAGIFQLVVGRGLRLGLVGVAVGVAGALAATRAMASMLVNIRPSDPYTFLTAAILFLSVVALACWIPARRAARLDPSAALRAE